ncbi:NUDIX domain-containing protein [Shewanella dokdonensis]|uniref:NUDIX domain-containing protein n=1 Tax=Shewanella dokdonensis TaxID=712036 RepID=UPI00314001F2
MAPLKDFGSFRGRILKDESIASAFKRLTVDELGICFTVSDAKFIGLFEHFYEDNFSGTDFTTHYVVLGYMLVADINIMNMPKTQHMQYEWFSRQSLLDSESVHIHTKWYLEKL